MGRRACRCSPRRGRQRQEERERDAAVTPGEETPGGGDEFLASRGSSTPTIVVRRSSASPHALTRSSFSLRRVRTATVLTGGRWTEDTAAARRDFGARPTVHGHGVDRRDEHGDQALRAYGRRRRAVDRRPTRARHRVRRAERRGEDDHDAPAARSRHSGRRGADPGKALRDHRETADRGRGAPRRACLPSEPLGAKSPPLARPEQRHSVGARTRCCGSSGCRRSPVGGRGFSLGMRRVWESRARCSAIRRS